MRNPQFYASGKRPIMLHLPTGEFLTNVQATLSDIPGPVHSGYNLDHIGYRKCANVDGDPPAAEDIRLVCQDAAIGRYLFIYLPLRMSMTICEVEVYGFGNVSYELCLVFVIHVIFSKEKIVKSLSHHVEN